MTVVENTVTESIWRRLRDDPELPDARSTYSRIVDTATSLADAQGLDAITMQRVAKRLDMPTMRLYRFVRSTEEIVELMVDAVFEYNLQVEDSMGWKSLLRSMAWQLRRAFLRHPWLVWSVAAAGPLTPNVVAHTDQLLAAVRRFGIDSDNGMVALLTVRSYTAGATASHLAQNRLLRREGADNLDGLADSADSVHAYLPCASRFPAYRRYVHEAERKDDAEWQFSVGLDCVLDGIGSHL
jgi:AcrR family transcriptional regulator